ncbi:HAMP domain-containing sensor histidine kinase [Bacteriovoracaceae bacterium]|nr:HAMP domain-containing sensor histidine kinase [Bacteriovoracaceae bacterium]
MENSGNSGIEETKPVLNNNTYFNYIYDSLKSFDESFESSKLFRTSKKFSSVFNSNTDNYNKNLDKLRRSLYQEINNNLQTIQTLPSFLINTHPFDLYDSCQIISHAKGSQTAQSFYSIKNSGSGSDFMKADIFVSLYKNIKKSKHKIFNQSQLNRSEIIPLGQFLAKEFTTSLHNIILIVGRNEFLPPEKIELDNFNTLIESLNPLFNGLLSRGQINEKIENLISILDMFPMPVAIFSNNGNLIFHNTEYENSHKGDTLKPNLSEKLYHLSGGNKLKVYFTISTEDADIYHYQRVSLLGELLNTLRHELSNPMFGIQLASDLLQNEIEDLEIKETISDINTYSSRCQEIIQNFSTLYRDENNVETIDVNTLLSEALLLAKSETRGIPLEKDFPSVNEIFLKTNPTWLTQILFNLVVNSSHAIRSKTNDLINQKIKVQAYAENNYLFIKVKDSGPGISEEIKSTIFKPFFTTKSKGTGLGLSICSSLIRKLGGTIKISDDSEMKTCLEVILPF